jgi:hypothetical protein
MTEEQSVPEMLAPAPLLPPETDAADAHKADLKRQARDLLAESDWRVVKDLEQSGAISEALSSYREALRAVARGEAFDLPALGQ